MSISVCIPTLNSYDELLKCIESINQSSVEVTDITIIDNGGKFEHPHQSNIYVHTLPRNIGVAASWNYFLDNIPQYRIICNDDIEFHEDTIETLIAEYRPDGMVSPTSLGDLNPWSCFLLGQDVIDKVGLFDEWISPNYGYFEDNDYWRRMTLAGFNITRVDTTIEHVQSSTLKHYTASQEKEHHRKFEIAKSHYVGKWGGLPWHEKYKTPFGK